ncbi:SDR family NAD(P)-dependent oxidoreductase [Shewanella dokdonensis]|uniref:SDR family oxidoreductase n=1 Tax=Shewanella dokdonensis TaxID=712036 RepID=A0ABX8DHB4_9GAMM|nr:SDR family NAD(P)-dependent oxidoreductase [Shewanella dokdonensis]MCL1076472.1 SDR family oxidoreductase [Shewanella dokdonensis]QVK23307.1 SDR family oxidoreductase [Shewanella dokdonensis]
MNFQGKVALVTGSTTGIGEAIAEQLHQHGAKVIIASRSLQKAQQKARSLSPDGQTALGIGCDVAKPGQVCQLIHDAVSHFGRLDYAVNNAGTTGEHNKNVTEQTQNNWENVITNSLSSVFYCMKYEIPEMLKSGGGAIVNLSAVNGLVGIAGLAPYTAAKHGVIGLTRSAALEFAGKGVRINAVAPGYVGTSRVNELPDDILRSFANSHPMERLAKMSEVAEFVMFLLSEKSSFCTGSVYPIDGGYLAR